MERHWQPRRRPENRPVVRRREWNAREPRGFGVGLRSQGTMAPADLLQEYRGQLQRKPIQAEPRVASAEKLPALTPDRIQREGDEDQGGQRSALREVIPEALIALAITVGFAASLTDTSWEDILQTGLVAFVLAVFVGALVRAGGRSSESITSSPQQTIQDEGHDAHPDLLEAQDAAERLERSAQEGTADSAGVQSVADATQRAVASVGSSQASSSSGGGGASSSGAASLGSGASSSSASAVGRSSSSGGGASSQSQAADKDWAFGIWAESRPGTLVEAGEMLVRAGRDAPGKSTLYSWFREYKSRGDEEEVKRAEPERVDVAAAHRAERVQRLFSKNIPHMEGEEKGKTEVKGGHVLQMMRAKWGDKLRIIDGTPNNGGVWKLVWTIENRKSKESTMFPASWNEGQLVDELRGAQVEGRFYVLPTGGIRVERKGDTFFPLLS